MLEVNPLKFKIPFIAATLLRFIRSHTKFLLFFIVSTQFLIKKKKTFVIFNSILRCKPVNQCLSIHLFIHPFIHLSIHPLIYSSIHSFIHSLIHFLFIHSFFFLSIISYFQMEWAWKKHQSISSSSPYNICLGRCTCSQTS